MFKFLSIIFILFLFLMMLAGFSVLRFLKTLLFGRDIDRQRDLDHERRRRAQQKQRQSEAHAKAAEQRRNEKAHPKVFDEAEGEYVDYEEVKDED